MKRINQFSAAACLLAAMYGRIGMRGRRITTREKGAGIGAFGGAAAGGLVGAAVGHPVPVPLSAAH